MVLLGRSLVVRLALLVLLVSGCQKGTKEKSSVTVSAPEIDAKKELPFLMEVPDFELETHDGKVVTRKTMEGEVWLASFVFTRCQTVCPGISAKMKAVESLSSKSAKALKIVTITVDPEYDTGAVLAEYAKRLDADLDRWQFWTGPRDEVEGLVTHGMKQLMIPRPQKPGEPMDIMHGGDLMLVDRKGQVRGRYKYRKIDTQELMQNIRTLL